MPAVVVPVPVHPVTGIKIVNNQLTVPRLLQQPTRITTALATIINEALAQTNMVGLFLAGGGGVTGGAVVYDRAPTNLDISNERQAEEIAPAAEYPLVSMLLAGEELLATVRKYGGKFYVTDEARDRNDVSSVALLTQYLAYTIQAKLNAAAQALVDAELAAAGMTATTSDWSAYDPTTMPASDSPLADLNEIRLHAPLGVTYDTLVLSSVDALVLQNQVLNMGFVGQSLPYGGALPTIVDMGDQLPVGKGYYIDQGALGQVRYEQGLRTVTWRAEDTDRTWVQSGIRPLMFVNNPGAGVALTIPGSDTWEGNVDFGPGFPPLKALMAGSEDLNAATGTALAPDADEVAPEGVAAEARQRASGGGGGDYSSDDVPDGTAAEVTGWVDGASGDDDRKARAQAALEKEQAGQNRSGLISQLQGIVNG